MQFIQVILRGVGQVMFQNNSYSGALFLVGIFYNSWLLGLAALIGTLTSTFAALLLNYSKKDIQNGLYGFNGALTGIAAWYFFEPSANSLLALVLGALLSTLVMRYLKKIIPPFTAPFVLVTWLLIYTLVFVFQFPLNSSSSPTLISVDLFVATSHSFGQVMFQENIITGLFFLLAITINNRLMAVYALYAAVLASLTAWLLAVPYTEINAGLMGYNAILCAIALAGKNRTDMLWITAAIILSTLLNIALATTGIITLTAPFVLVTWIILNIKNKTYQRLTREKITDNRSSL